MLRKLALVLALAAIHAPRAHAETPTWVVVGFNSSHSIEISLKRGSCDISPTIISCVEQNSMNGSHYYSHVSTTKAMCKAGFGRIVNTDSNDKLISSNEVASAGNSIAASEFDFLCYIADHTGDTL